MPIKRDYSVEVTLTEIEIAECIWAMDGDQQARMLHHLAEISKEKICFQLQYVADSKCLSIEAKMLMQKIGEYGM